MSRLTRVVVLVTALASLCAALSSTAGAVTWHNTGSTAFTATGGPGTLSIGSNNLACSASSGTAPAPGGSVTTSTYTISWTHTFSPCSLVGQNAFLHCNFRLTLSLFSGGTSSGGLDVTCDARLTAASSRSLCHLNGSVTASLSNPFGTTKGRITLPASSTVTVSNGDVSCPLGTGTGSWTEQTINVTNGTSTTLGPVLNRTA